MADGILGRQWRRAGPLSGLVAGKGEMPLFDSGLNFMEGACGFSKSGHLVRS